MAETSLNLSMFLIFFQSAKINLCGLKQVLQMIFFIMVNNIFNTSYS